MKRSAREQFENRRRQQLAAIHIGRDQLGLDEETYRDMIEQVSATVGVAHRSAADLDEPQRDAVIAAMRAKGAAQPAAKSGSKAGTYPGKPANFAGMPEMITKIEAQLADMKLPWSYADAICRRQFGIQRIGWCRKEEQLRAVIAALHVEQEKRTGGVVIDKALAARGMTEDQLAEQIKLPKNWRRQRKVLDAVLAWLRATAEEPKA